MIIFKYIFLFSLSRQRQLKFNPPIEEIRMKYFSLLKKFISVPIGFHGIVDSAVSIFASIVDRYVKINYYTFILFNRFNDILLLFL